MKISIAVSLALLASMAASAQRVGSPRTPPPSAISGHPVGALGGSYASVGISRPLGGIVAPSTRGKYRGYGAGYGYVGPVYYVPNAYDLGYSSSTYSTFNTPANPALYYTPSAAAQPWSPPASTSQPIIINQYFGTRTSSNSGSTTTTSESEGPAANPGDPVGAPQKYYLIAYKDHSVYSALAYWLEGDTLHYVTTQNTHNQASLALLDLEQTTKLNNDASMPFSLK